MLGKIEFGILYFLVGGAGSWGQEFKKFTLMGWELGSPVEAIDLFSWTTLKILGAFQSG